MALGFLNRVDPWTYDLTIIYALMGRVQRHMVVCPCVCVCVLVRKVLQNGKKLDVGKCITGVMQ